jgi:hypothetical protein
MLQLCLPVLRISGKVTGLVSEPTSAPVFNLLDLLSLGRAAVTAALLVAAVRLVLGVALPCLGHAGIGGTVGQRAVGRRLFGLGARLVGVKGRVRVGGRLVVGARLRVLVGLGLERLPVLVVLVGHADGAGALESSYAAAHEGGGNAGGG